MKRNQYISLRSQDLRAHILKIAGECVDQFGLRGTTVLKVAEMSGVSRQTVHSYFPTKEILLGEVIVAYLLAGIEKTLAKVDLSKPPRAVVEEAFRGMLKHMQQLRGRRLMALADRDIAVRANATQDILGIAITKLWTPILSHLKANGHLHPGVDLEDAGKWLYLVHFGVLEMKWIKPRDLHRLIETFVAPSILTST